MSRRGSKSLNFSSSDEDEKKSSFKQRNRTFSSSSSEKTQNSIKQKETGAKSRSLSRVKRNTDESSSDEDSKKKSQSKPHLNYEITQSDSDSDSASDSTITKSTKSSHGGLINRSRNLRSVGERKRRILKSSSSSGSRSNSPDNLQNKVDSDSDSESTTLGSSILKINIKSKPPIDKERHNRKLSSRQSNFEKPNSDSESDSKTSSNRSKNSKKLIENFDADSQDSNNDMTDVSSLASPRETKIKMKCDKFEDDEDARRGRSAFYSALHQKSHTRPNSVNFNLTNNYTNSTSFSEKTYGPDSLRIEAQQRPMFNEFLNENRGLRKIKDNRPFRLTSSAINRQREQQRIEKENQLILKRLLSVKSSKDVRKDNQLKDYERNMGLSDFNLSRNSVKSGLSTKRSQKSSVCNSRISSAKSINRGQTSADYSYKTLGLSRRPEWNNRW